MNYGILSQKWYPPVTPISRPIVAEERLQPEPPLTTGEEKDSSDYAMRIIKQVLVFYTLDSENYRS
jgi:hypothetical protein